MGFASVESVKAFLGKNNAEHDGLLKLLVDGVSKRMEGYMGRAIEVDEYVSEPIESPGFPSIAVDHSPITNVITVIENSTTLTAADYRVEDGSTLMRLSGGAATSWSKGTVFVTYEAGHEDVPADLELACVEQVALEYGMTPAGGGTLGLVSKSPTQASGESTRYQQKAWLPQVQAAMNNHPVLL